MEMLGHPIAVYPDPEVANLGNVGGSPVIGDDHFTETALDKNVDTLYNHRKYTIKRLLWLTK